MPFNMGVPMRARTPTMAAAIISSTKVNPLSRTSFPPTTNFVRHTSTRSPPWGVATIDLKTPECGHHILFLSQDLQNEGGNSHDDRTGRISARPPMGQARPWEYTYHSRGDGCLGCPVSPGGATRHFGRSGPGLTGRAGRFWSVVSAAGAALVVWAGARSGDDQSSTDPPSTHAPGGGSARRGGAGHHPARALGSLVGWHRRRWPHAPHRLGRHPISLAQGALPGHDAGAHRAAPAG